MTWRERIVAARERGAFTEGDRADSDSAFCCAVGETLTASPLGLTGETFRALHADGINWAGTFPTAVYANNFDRAEEILDGIEDRVLTLKREL